MKTNTAPNLIGNKFNRLTVLKRSYKINGKGAYWLCLCDCGNKRIISASSLRNNHAKSCGCWRQENGIFQLKLLSTHGKSDTKVFNTYKALQYRCSNKNLLCYKNYGGRGIKCEWKSFEEFYKDMGESPSVKHSIDRIDNNGNYCKKNCRWATRKEQQNNRRNNHLITFEGKTLTLTAWSELKNINYITILQRISRGWPVEKALTQKAQFQNHAKPLRPPANHNNRG